MRILHLVHQYMPEYVGGTELYTRWLAEGLSALGHQASVFYRAPSDQLILSHRTDAHNVGVGSAGAGVVTPKRRFLAIFGDSHLLTSFQKVLAEESPDLLHIQHLMGLPLSLIDELVRQNIPYIVTLHDYWWVCANAQLLTNYNQTVCDGPRAYWNCARCALARGGKLGLFPALPPLVGLLGWRNWLLRRALAAAARIIAPTRFVADWYAQHGVSAERMTVIPHGLPLPNTLPVAGSDITAVGGRQSTVSIRFAYIGGLSWQKGVHVLIEAFNDLGEGAELWIAGDESAEPDYVAQLRQSASKRVRFLGRLNREDVWQILANVDAIVMPSVWYESFSIIISEAFSMGVPVIASNIGALADRVQHEKDGLLTPPGDATAMRQTLQRFLDEPDLLAQLQQGIQPIQSIEDHAVEMETVYKSGFVQ